MYNFDKIKPGRPKQPLTLTARQMNYVILQAQGLTRKEIAKELNINKHTLGSNISHMLKRWNVRTVTALVVKAIKLGFIDPCAIEVEVR